MAMEDPFFLVKEEVLQSLRNAQGLHAQFLDLLNDKGDSRRVEAVQSDLNKAVKSIEWDLQDLDQTISVAQCDPGRFHMEPSELLNRQQFVTDTKAVVEAIKKDITGEPIRSKVQASQRSSLLGPSAGGHPGNQKGRGRYSKMENELKQGNQDFIDDQIQSQQHVMRAQDQDLDKVAASLNVLGHMGQEIGGELDDQNRMLEDLSHDIENTDSRLASLLKRVEKVSKKAGDKCQIVTIVVLVIVLVIVIVLFIIPF